MHSKSVLSDSAIKRFRSDLLRWFDVHQRDLPWRRTRDPYRIWISEIMLQQTRVAAVIPFYERFLSRFPDIHALASAPPPELLAHWAGLGYYSRAHQLQRAAQEIAREGAFPESYEAIQQLPGVGDYTSAAVASIAFNLPRAAVDGNVLRVLSRLFDDATSVSAAAGRKHFHGIACELIDREQPGAFNQAMMELGATICLPKNPRCLLCPVAKTCRARETGSQSERPVKTAKTERVEEERAVFWIEESGNLLVWQRPATSRLMPGFWELPEAAHLPSLPESRKLGSFRHSITHHDYRFEVWAAAFPAAAVEEPAPCRWMPLTDLPHSPVSTVLKKAQKVIENLRAPRRVQTVSLQGKI
jgi:A/G-specific adenine glycosylase